MNATEKNPFDYAKEELVKWVKENTFIRRPSTFCLEWLEEPHPAGDVSQTKLPCLIHYAKGRKVSCKWFEKPEMVSTYEEWWEIVRTTWEKEIYWFDDKKFRYAVSWQAGHVLKIRRFKNPHYKYYKKH